MIPNFFLASCIFCFLAFSFLVETTGWLSVPVTNPVFVEGFIDVYQG